MENQIEIKVNPLSEEQRIQIKKLMESKGYVENEQYTELESDVIKFGEVE